MDVTTQIESEMIKVLIIRIHTNMYAGNFEREMFRYITGYEPEPEYANIIDKESAKVFTIPDDEDLSIFAYIGGDDSNYPLDISTSNVIKDNQPSVVEIYIDGDYGIAAPVLEILSIRAQEFAKDYSEDLKIIKIDMYIRKTIVTEEPLAITLKEIK